MNTGFNTHAVDGSSALPAWLPTPPPRTTSRAVEGQTFLVPYLPRSVQQTRDVRDYDLDYSEVIPRTDEVISAAVSVEPPGLTLQHQVIAARRLKVWIEGGVRDAAHKVTVVARTAGGRVHESEFKVRIKDR